MMLANCSAESHRVIVSTAAVKSFTGFGSPAYTKAHGVNTVTWVISKKW
ncbi:hypothetical protein yaldo0001_38830 [Yersinia aldovae ATCC 35236]|nr:hypothetical protein yaldo0001_38830 [Yersinia aldovae ATCC 35236]